MSANTERFARQPLSGGGTPAEVSRRWDRSLPELELGGCRTLYVVSPHPDDETLGFGASAATLQARGIDVRVVSVTDGEASLPGLSSPQRTMLARFRRTELDRATEVLGLAPSIRLGLPDGEVDAHLPALTDMLVELFETAPGTWCAATWSGDGQSHRSHPAEQRLG